MTKTPRTDAQAVFEVECAQGFVTCVPASFARELEAELAQAQRDDVADRERHIAVQNQTQAMLYNAFKSLRGQSKGMQRMARKIARLRAEKILKAEDELPIAAPDAIDISGNWCCKHEQELAEMKTELAYVHDTDGAALNAEVTAREKAGAECDRLRKDAERYRWLRCCTVAKFRELQHVNIVKGVHFDAQIDAEINAARN